MRSSRLPHSTVVDAEELDAWVATLDAARSTDGLDVERLSDALAAHWRHSSGHNCGAQCTAAIAHEYAALGDSGEPQ